MSQFFSSSELITSDVIRLEGYRTPCYQLAVSGSGAVSAEAVVEGSHDGIGWIPIVTLTATGTDYATDGGPVETSWPRMRARLTAISGGTATLYYTA